MPPRYFAYRANQLSDEETHEYLYWSNEDGWVTLQDATIFSEDEVNKHNRPLDSTLTTILFVDME